MLQFFTRALAVATFIAIGTTPGTDAQSNAQYPSFRNLNGPDGIASGDCGIYKVGLQELKGLMECHISVATLGSMRWGEKLRAFRQFNNMTDGEIRATTECLAAQSGSFADWTRFLLSGPDEVTSLSQKTAQEFREITRMFCETPSHENKSKVLEFVERFREKSCILQLQNYVVIFEYDSHKKIWNSKDVTDSRDSIMTFQLWTEDDDYRLRQVGVSGRNETRPVAPTTTVKEFTKAVQSPPVNCTNIIQINLKKVA